jgi:nitroreductase
MSFEELTKKRQSCRKFGDQRVEKEKLEKIISMARLTPSACNSQPWKIHVVHDEEKAKEFSSFLRDFGMNPFTKNVTTFIAVSELRAKLSVGSKLKYDNNHFVKYDIGQIVAYITLAAEEIGLSTCILGWLNNKKIAEFLQFEEGEECNVVIAVGYSDIAVRDKVRKPIEEISKWH